MNCASAVSFFVLFAAAPVFQAAESRGRILDRSGTVLAETIDGIRSYPLKELTSHLTGYVRAGDNLVGVAGLEKSLDEPLKLGEDITLAIDIRIQKIAADVFPEGKNGAMVVIEPNTGAILALASFPGFDPNEFIPTIAEDRFVQFQSDPRAPLFNRAIHPSPPGSIYKIPVAFAACLSGLHEKSFRCDGGVVFGKQFMRCWISGTPAKRHGDLNLSDAIKHSCNAYFYQCGNSIGIESIEKSAGLLGLNDPTGCGLPQERSGTTPTKWAKTRGIQWTNGDIANFSIGQGVIEMTPLQAASMAGTIANGGKIYQVHLVQQDGPNPMTDLTQSGIPADRIDLIRNAMRRVVNEEGGTGSNARSDSFEIAGKTGTAHMGNPKIPFNAWFIGFAPYEDPTLAVCIFVENGTGNRDAAPLAREVLTQSLALPDQ